MKAVDLTTGAEIVRVHHTTGARTPYIVADVLDDMPGSVKITAQRVTGEVDTWRELKDAEIETES